MSRRCWARGGIDDPRGWPPRRSAGKHPIHGIGETTNLAARLQSAAGAGEIVLSGEAYRRVREWLEVQSIIAEEGNVTAKGFADPVRVFRLPTPQGLRRWES